MNRFDGWLELWRFGRMFPRLIFKAAGSNLPVLERLINCDDGMEESAVEEEIEACQTDDVASVLSTLSSETITDNEQY